MNLDDNAVEEFASSLNLLISDLADWNWPIKGVRGIFRRNLVGKYRCFYEEDFLTAIFLQHIGLKWSSHFKKQLQILFEVLTKEVRTNCSSNSIQYERYSMQKDKYWMALLPDEQISETYEMNYENMDKVNLKSKLLYLINTEIQLHQVLKPNTSFTIVSADLEYFGPSISHEIVRIFLEFCGITKIWLDFFDRFLKQPIYYEPDEQIRQRQRGAPISHSLSFLFSELLLFGMDLYVYQTTGIFIYRLHDDIWFFDSQSDKIEQAWTLMNEYTQMTSLKFNEEKCGSIKVQPSVTTSHDDELSINVSSLPRKAVKWGLLTLQPSGRFVIRQETIIPFLDELKTHLTNATTVLEWVNLYNQYISFFMRNFGQCANILGTYHIDQMIEAFQFVHRYVFPETNGNALTMLTNRIVQQFPNCLTDEIYEAWLYWPLTRGGLGLRNIYVTLYSLKQYLLSTRISTFNQLPTKDAELYGELVTEYEKDKCNRRDEYFKAYIDDKGKLITFDEYIQRRETHLSHWKDVYVQMLTITRESLPTLTNTMQDDVRILRDGIREMLPYEHRSWYQDSTSYLEWLYCYYGEQIQSTFNQFDFIGSESIPIGLIAWMKTTQIDWNKESDKQQ